MNIEITDGGKLFIDGTEIKLSNKNGNLATEDWLVVVSACNLHVKGNYIKTITQEEYEKLKENIK